MTFLTCGRPIVVALLSILATFNCQLVVNVKNNGGDVYRENIEANTTQDSIALEFRKADGTVVTHFIDGRNVSYDNIFYYLFMFVLVSEYLEC